MSDPAAPSPAAGERYEATVHVSELALTTPGAVSSVDDLDLDRVPDPDGGIRVLVDPTDISRLVAQGFEVRLHRAVPVQPLDRALIADDDEVTSWLTARLNNTGGR